MTTSAAANASCRVGPSAMHPASSGTWAMYAWSFLLHQMMTSNRSSVIASPSRPRAYALGYSLSPL